MAITMPLIQTWWNVANCGISIDLLRNQLQVYYDSLCETGGLTIWLGQHTRSEIENKSQANIVNAVLPNAVDQADFPYCLSVNAQSTREAERPFGSSPNGLNAFAPIQKVSSSYTYR